MIVDFLVMNIKRCKVEYRCIPLYTVEQDLSTLITIYWENLNLIRMVYVTKLLQLHRRSTTTSKRFY